MLKTFSQISVLGKSPRDRSVKFYWQLTLKVAKDLQISAFPHSKNDLNGHEALNWAFVK